MKETEVLLVVQNEGFVMEVLSIFSCAKHKEYMMINRKIIIPSIGRILDKKNKIGKNRDAPVNLILGGGRVGLQVWNPGDFDSFLSIMSEMFSVFGAFGH